MTAKVQQRLWFVMRSTRDGKRLPRLQWIAVARFTKKMVYLVKPRHGRKAFRRSELGDSWLYFENILDALNDFQRRAEHWKECALDDLDWAHRDVKFVEETPVAKIMRYAKEAT